MYQFWWAHMPSQPYNDKYCSILNSSFRGYSLFPISNFHIHPSTSDEAQSFEFYSLVDSTALWNPCPILSWSQPETNTFGRSICPRWTSYHGMIILHLTDLLFYRIRQYRPLLFVHKPSFCAVAYFTDRKLFFASRTYIFVLSCLSDSFQTNLYGALSWKFRRWGGLYHRIWVLKKLG